MAKKMTKKEMRERKEMLIRCRRAYVERGAKLIEVTHLDGKKSAIANPMAVKAAMDAIKVELDFQILELGGDPERSGLNEVVRDWMLRVHPGERDFLGDFSETVTFIELARRMRDGENIYDVLDCGESEQRVRCFERLAELTDTDRHLWYDLWLNSGEKPRGAKRKEQEEKRRELARVVNDALKAKGYDPAAE